MVNFGPLAAEIVSLVWGTPGNFNGFRVLAALLHGTLVVGVTASAKLCGVERQGGHHVGHWPTFLVLYYFNLTYIYALYRPTYLCNLLCHRNTNLIQEGNFASRPLR